MTIISQSDTELEMQFVDGAGQSVTIDFERADVNSPWRAAAPLQVTEGIAFGRQNPSLPTLARLRDRSIDPATVVMPFQPGFYAGAFDDLTIYQLDGGELGVAVHSNDLVVAIGYARYVVEAAYGPSPPQSVCAIIQSACCEGTGNPPAPDLTSCKNLIKYCNNKAVSCTCMLNWCEGNVNGTPHPASCNQWLECCHAQPPPPTPCDPPQVGQYTPVDIFMVTVLDLVQYRLDK